MKKNLLTKLMSLAGGVTFRRSFREGGVDVNRPVDMDGVARVEEAIKEGWLLHFPAGTTKKGAPLRSGVSRLLHNTKAVALPLRVDGFRDLLLHKQLPGKLFKRCSLKIHPPARPRRLLREALQPGRRRPPPPPPRGHDRRRRLTRAARRRIHSGERSGGSGGAGAGSPGGVVLRLQGHAGVEVGLQLLEVTLVVAGGVEERVEADDLAR